MLQLLKNSKGHVHCVYIQELWNHLDKWRLQSTMGQWHGCHHRLGQNCFWRTSPPKTMKEEMESFNNGAGSTLSLWYCVVPDSISNIQRKSTHQLPPPRGVSGPNQSQGTKNVRAGQGASHRDWKEGCWPPRAPRQETLPFILAGSLWIAKYTQCSGVT